MACEGERGGGQLGEGVNCRILTNSTPFWNSYLVREAVGSVLHQLWGHPSWGALYFALVQGLCLVPAQSEERLSPHLVRCFAVVSV